MQKTIIVLAGSHEQFQVYLSRARRDRETEYVYGGNAHSLMGKVAYDVVTYGTFWERPDASGLFNLAELAKERYKNYC